MIIFLAHKHICTLIRITIGLYGEDGNITNAIKLIYIQWNVVARCAFNFYVRYWLKESQTNGQRCEWNSIQYYDDGDDDEQIFPQVQSFNDHIYYIALWFVIKS